jgi:rubrerythrin
MQWQKNRQAKKLAEEAKTLERNLKPVIDLLAEQYGTQLSTKQIQKLVAQIVSAVSRIHYHSDEPPQTDGNLSRGYAGKIVACDVCRANDIKIEPNGACPNCKLHNVFWWGKAEVSKS